MKKKLSTSKTIQTINKQKNITIMSNTNNILSMVPTGNRIPMIGNDRATIIPFVIEELKNSSSSIIFNNGSFYVYNGRNWENVIAPKMGLFIKEFALKIGCPEKVANPFWGIEAFVKQAEYDLFTEFSTNKDVLNFENGTLELDTLLFREHRKEDYLLYSLPYAYDKNAQCPKWMKFLSEVLPNKDLQTLLQEAFAYPLSRLHLEKLVYLYGDGLNGKSVALEVFSRVLGRENTTAISLEQITCSEGKYIVSMIGKLANISYENSQNIFNNATFKNYVSGERLTVRSLYGHPFTTDDYPPSILSANNLPIVNEFTNGLFRRFLIIPFNVTIEKEKINTNLINELCEELPGICNWLIEGVRRLKENKKFIEVEEVTKLFNEFRTESDSVSLFVDELMYKPSDLRKILLCELYKEFDIWAKDNGYKKMSSKTFSKRLRSLGFQVNSSTGNAVYVWVEKESINSYIKNNDETEEENNLFPF